MKKFLVAASMAAAMAIVVGGAFADQFEIIIPWYVNDPIPPSEGGTGGCLGRQGFNSWITLFNKSEVGPLTLYLDFYDAANYFIVATTDTVSIVSHAGVAYWTGIPCSKFSMYAGSGNNPADKGDIIVRWNPLSSSDSDKDELRGYYNTINWDYHYAFAVGFDY